MEDALDDPHLHVLLAELAWARYESCGEGSAQRAQFVDSTIEHARNAVEMDAGDSAAHRLLGKALAEKGESVEAAKSLMQSYELNPAYPRLNLELALFLQAFGRPDLAAPFTERAAAWAAHPDVRNRARQLADEIANAAPASP